MKELEPCKTCGLISDEVLERRREKAKERMREAKRKAREEGRPCGAKRQYDYDRIIKLHEEGHSGHSIARMIGSSDRPVRNAIHIWRKQREH